MSIFNKAQCYVPKSKIFSLQVKKFTHLEWDIRSLKAFNIFAKMEFTELFFVFGEILYYMLLEPGQTVTKQSYSEQLSCLNDALEEKRSFSWQKSQLVILFQDNSCSFCKDAAANDFEKFFTIYHILQTYFDFCNTQIGSFNKIKTLEYSLKNFEQSQDSPFIIEYTIYL